MWKYKLALATIGNSGMDTAEQIKLFAETGFEGFFTDWQPERTAEFVALAKSLGTEYQSIHAPMNKTDDLWEDDEALAKKGLDELIACLHDCADNEIEIMVSHCIIGFDHFTPTEIGLERYGRLIDEAEKCGVKIAFENTEGEEYLAAIMDNFGDNPYVGFCWDTGHEMCYNHSKDLLALYGNNLIATHLNDNLGIRDYGGKITYVDDLHLLPFDGIADWKYNAERLDKWGFDGFMTFELKYGPSYMRKTNDCYLKMTFEEYVNECYKRACKVAYLRK